MINNISNTKVKVTASGPGENSSLLSKLTDTKPSQTKLIIVPFYALTPDPETFPEIFKIELEKFKSKFDDRNRYVFVIDYRRNAEFKVIDLNNTNIGLPTPIAPCYGERDLCPIREDWIIK